MTRCLGHPTAIDAQQAKAAVERARADAQQARAEAAEAEIARLRALLDDRE